MAPPATPARPTSTQTAAPPPFSPGLAELPPGLIVAGRYRIVEVIGAGGAGTVHRADDLLLRRPVALKILHRAPTVSLNERLRREVLAGGDPHPNLVRTLEVGQWEGRWFLTMELIDGPSLKQQLASGRTLDAPQARRLVTEVLRGLAHLHAQGVARARLERYSRLSLPNVLLHGEDVAGAARALDAIPDGVLGGDPLARAFLRYVQGRTALMQGRWEVAEARARESFALYPGSDDAPMLLATARLLAGGRGDVGAALAHDPKLTMGSPADCAEIRGHLAWLEGDDAGAWSIYESAAFARGLQLQCKARVLLGQDEANKALELLEVIRQVPDRERLHLLRAIALGRLGRAREARQALAAETARHPWIKAEADLVGSWLDALNGQGTRGAVDAALAGARARALWDLYAYLDLPFHLGCAAEALSQLGDGARGLALLGEAARLRPHLGFVERTKEFLASGRSQRRTEPSAHRPR